MKKIYWTPLVLINPNVPKIKDEVHGDFLWSDVLM